ncbi:unnamed protein product [Cylindrotheca closterium]|uniref:Uncharacterized protein n=1 Tax=Cylindrotheca closterium TaxID=2856 RepID=A0AAD2JGV3_9STRA|nr:unnamed protein product [Cylindrotheca closterium]
MKLSTKSLVLLTPRRTSFALVSLASKAGTGVHKPVGKDGEGEYTAATKGCFDVIDTATPAILGEIFKQDAISSPRAYHIADYGTADAGTSLGLLSRMVESVRKHNNNDEQEVVVHYEDQLTNEWQSVFRHALGLKHVKDAYGNHIETPIALGNVYAEASGVGFHNQCYASNSIDFAISFTAMHWLSSCDVSSLSGTPFMHAARCPEAPQSEKVQAADDWKAILKARSKELVKGGRFVCVNFCVSKEGYFLGQTGKGKSMWDSFETAWNQLHEEGLIDDKEKDAISFPSYYRTMDEFLQGIGEVGGFKVVSAEEKIVPCPYRELYTSGKTSFSEREYAEWFVPTTRTWSHSTFQSALNQERNDKEAIMGKFWDNYISLVAKNPTEHGMDYVHAYIVLEKV